MFDSFGSVPIGIIHFEMFRKPDVREFSDIFFYVFTSWNIFAHLLLLLEQLWHISRRKRNEKECDFMMSETHYIG
jgi:hypothetical protein